MRSIALFLALLLPVSAFSQSYNFTLTNESYQPCSGCATVVGYGTLTVSPSQVVSIQGSGYPIMSLTGMFNGQSISLASVPNLAAGNLFTHQNGTPPWYAPLYFSSSAGKYSLSQPSNNIGQYLTGPGISQPVLFTVTPTPQFSTVKPPFTGTSSPVVFQRPVASPIRRSLNPVVFEISIPAAIFAGVFAFELLRHHRYSYYAVPAGRF